MNHDSFYGLVGTKVNVTDAWSHCKTLVTLQCFARVGILQNVYSRRKTGMQQTGKDHVFILLFAILCKLVEIKFYSNLPEAVKGSLVFQGFSKFS